MRFMALFPATLRAEQLGNAPSRRAVQSSCSHPGATIPGAEGVRGDVVLGHPRGAEEPLGHPSGLLEVRQAAASCVKRSRRRHEGVSPESPSASPLSEGRAEEAKV